MTEQPGRCRICGAQSPELALAGLPGAFQDTYSLYRCRECSFVTTHPLPGEDLLLRYYAPDYWVRGKGRSRVFDLLFRARMAGLMHRLQKALPQGARVLDWGCGDGALPALMRGKGFEAYGLDKFIPAKVSPWLIQGDIGDDRLEKGSFAAITCFHLLEHLSDPVRDLRLAFDLLAPGGIMILEVPNISSLGFQVFGTRWQPLEIPLHVNHFTPASLKYLIGQIDHLALEKAATFSWRTSASSIVLSLFPKLAPGDMRRRNRGRHPLSWLLAYLFLQIGALPFATAEAALNRGEVLRLWLRKYDG
ncbi:MAG: class I SAM-dependent methyltransferase [Desulfohalobiaceae bacterium]|nr:class I SAM-dependent methyltransferase [Desulfohalobiaceae bacterium]